MALFKLLNDDSKRFKSYSAIPRLQKEKESLRSSFIDCLNKAIASLGDFF